MIDDDVLEDDNTLDNSFDDEGISLEEMLYGVFEYEDYEPDWHDDDPDSPL